MASSSKTIAFISPLSKKNIEICLDPLPACHDVIQTLSKEKAQLTYWIIAAKFFYSIGNQDNFCEILETSRDKASQEYSESENDQMVLLDSLAAHYVHLAKRETNKELKREHIIRATRLYTAADKIIMLHEDHLIGRAFLCLMETDKIDQADAQFNFVLDQNPDNVLALLGKAKINFLKNDIKLALFYYRKALEIFPHGLRSLKFLTPSIYSCRNRPLSL
ncbi:hypothetical protein MXB_4165 [Myxobolus squamalis]|nr:hypothetical protein MXB_4165 [Myxobolus squamalis]